jgi:hypothetical protein
MDPITTTHLVQDRTEDLQRIADQVRQERSMRSTPPAAAIAEATASPARPIEAPRSAAAAARTNAGGSAPAEPAV